MATSSDVLWRLPTRTRSSIEEIPFPRFSEENYSARSGDRNASRTLAGARSFLRARDKSLLTSIEAIPSIVWLGRRARCVIGWRDATVPRAGHDDSPGEFDGKNGEARAKTRGGVARVLRVCRIPPHAMAACTGRDLRISISTVRVQRTNPPFRFSFLRGYLAVEIRPRSDDAKLALVYRPRRVPVFSSLPSFPRDDVFFPARDTIRR